MNKYVEGFLAAGVGSATVHVVPTELFNDYPSLAQAMQGVHDEEKDRVIVPAVKFLLWAECGRIDASILTYKGGKKAFVSLPAATPWEQALNDMFEAGAIPWKR